MHGKKSESCASHAHVHTQHTHTHTHPPAPSKSYVETLTTGTSECDCVCRRVFEEVIKVKCGHVGEPLIQSDWCLYEKRRLGHTETHKG